MKHKTIRMIILYQYVSSLFGFGIMYVNTKKQLYIKLRE